MEHRLRHRQHSTGSDVTTSSEDSGGSNAVLSLEHKSIQTYKSQDEYLYAMKEDLAEWFNALYNLDIGVDSFFERLETGVLLSHHANNVNRLIRESELEFGGACDVPPDVQYREKNVKAGSFLSRDNVSNFIDWCRLLGINQVVRFETDDLVLRKNPRSVVLCLLEVARRGARYGMLAPCLVQLEQEIEAEIAGEPLPPKPQQPAAQIKTIDMLSLDEMVREIAGRCTCPTQFQITRVSEGKYRVGESQTLIFVRILRVHVMVRIGGGWDTLEHYLDKHDPCRCNVGHKTPAKVKRHSVLPPQRPPADTPVKQATPKPGATPNMEKKRSHSLAPGSSASRELNGMLSTLPPDGSRVAKQAEHKSRRQSIDVVISRTVPSKTNSGTRTPRSMTRPGSATPSRERSISRQPERPMTPSRERSVNRQPERPMTSSRGRSVQCQPERPMAPSRERSVQRQPERPMTPSQRGERSSTPVSFKGRPNENKTVNKQSKLHKNFHSTGNVNTQNDLSLSKTMPTCLADKSINTPKPQRQRRQSIGDMSSQLKTSGRSIDLNGRQSPSPDRRRSLSVATKPRASPSRNSPSPEPRHPVPTRTSRGRTPSPEPTAQRRQSQTSQSDINSSQSKLLNRYQTLDGTDKYSQRKDGTSSESSSTRSSPTRTLPVKSHVSDVSYNQEQGRPPSAASRLRPRTARSASVGPREELSRTFPMKAFHNDLHTLTVRRDDSGRHNIEAVNKKVLAKHIPPRTNVRTTNQRTSMSTPNTPKLRRAIFKTPQAASTLSNKPNIICDNQTSENFDENKNSNVLSSNLLQQSFDHIPDVSPEDISMNDQMEQLFEALCKQVELQEKFTIERKLKDDSDDMTHDHVVPCNTYKRSSSVDDILKDPPTPSIQFVPPAHKRNAAIVTPMRRRSPSPQPLSLIDKEYGLSNDLLDKDALKTNTPNCAKPRKDAREGTPTRIPGPRSNSNKYAAFSLYDPLAQLSRFDSGVDVNNISPTDLKTDDDLEEY